MAKTVPKRRQNVSKSQSPRPRRKQAHTRQTRSQRTHILSSKSNRSSQVTIGQRKRKRSTRSEVRSVNSTTKSKRPDTRTKRSSNKGSFFKNIPLPVVVIDEHHGAFKATARAIAEGRLHSEVPYRVFMII